MGSGLHRGMALVGTVNRKDRNLLVDSIPLLMGLLILYLIAATISIDDEGLSRVLCMIWALIVGFIMGYNKRREK